MSTNAKQRVNGVGREELPAVPLVEEGSAFLRLAAGVELRDAAAPHFFPVGRFERKHELSLRCVRDYRCLILSIYENAKP